LFDTGLEAKNYFRHEISPQEIFSAADHPKLEGTITGVPGASVCKNLANGADHAWDASRQVSTSYTKSSFALTLHSCSDLNGAVYPTGDDANIVGNDDGEVADEIHRNPYDAAALGYLTDNDMPGRSVSNTEGNAGDFVRFTLLFREFTRVKIGLTWYRISPFYPWRVVFAFKKEASQGTSYWTMDSGSIMENGRN